MSSFKLSGKIKAIFPTEVVNPKFSKREFVVETQDQYPQLVMFQTTQDKCAILQSFGIGDQVDVSFNVRGKEWVNQSGTPKYFNTLEAWRIDKEGAPKQAIAQGSNPLPKSNKPVNEEDGDLPF
jgi:hypothetical protein